MKLKKIF